MDKTCKTGDKIQKIDYGSSPHKIYDGEVINFIPALKVRTRDYYSLSDKEKNDMTDHIEVKFDDGITEVLPANEVFPRDSEMERQFRNTADIATKDINVNLSIAARAIEEAESIAETYGIPFSSSVSPLSQGYTPESLDVKFPNLSKDFIYEVTETSNEYGNSGWEHSQVC